jgi:ribosomal-protein-alanine N-acetyltransferase
VALLSVILNARWEFVPVIHLQTDRLFLRDWEERDLGPFAAMNADPRVMEFFPSLCSRQESDEMVARLRQSIAENGFGFFALESRDSAEFIGFTGLFRPRFQAHFMPAVEIGWRLKADAWGQGYASEAARACLCHGFGCLGLEEIVAFTAAVNRRSIAVMERIGMTRRPDEDFEHPKLPERHPLRPHVLYRISRA